MVQIDIGALLKDPQVEAILRIVVAGLIAGLIGLERTLAGKPAGIRTYGLVGMGAAIFTVTAINGFGSLDYASRIVGGIITGVGFLGAGTILHTRVQVIGLTTAAGLWVAAGVGLAIGTGLYLIGIVAGVLLFILLQFASPEEYLSSQTKRSADNGGDDDGEEGEAAATPVARSPVRPTKQTLNLGPGIAPWSTTQSQGGPKRG